MICIGTLRSLMVIILNVVGNSLITNYYIYLSFIATIIIATNKSKWFSNLIFKLTQILVSQITSILAKYIYVWYTVEAVNDKVPQDDRSHRNRILLASEDRKNIFPFLIFGIFLSLIIVET